MSAAPERLAVAAALQVELVTLPAWQPLEREWRALEARSETSFFLSWSWIGPWLACLPATVKPRLLRATRGSEVLGLAVAVDARIHELPLPVGRAVWLNATGDSALDAITIEHNGLLLDRRGAAETRAALWARLFEPGCGWRRVVLPNLAAAHAPAATLLPARTVLEERVRTSWVVALERAREHAQGYLGVLSAKTRWNVQKSLRACAAIGPLQLVQAHDLAQAQAFFERMLVLHAQRWQGRGLASAFDTEFSRRFHARLLADNFARGEVQLLRLCAGEREVGYVYSFVHRQRVYFYQSGFDYELLGPRFSPGMLTLVQAIEHNARLGHAVFDLLAGVMPYKRALATDSESMVTIRVHHVERAYRLEQWLRRHVRPLAQRVRAWRGAAG